MSKGLDPEEWVNHANWCVYCCKHSKKSNGVTRWITGQRSPVRAGWYERLFTDGVFRHYWGGVYWAGDPDGIPHWRQVGSYPCWRGLATPNTL